MGGECRSHRLGLVRRRLQSHCVCARPRAAGHLHHTRSQWSSLQHRNDRPQVEQKLYDMCGWRTGTQAVRHVFWRLRRSSACLSQGPVVSYRYNFVCAWHQRGALEQEKMQRFNAFLFRQSESLLRVDPFEERSSARRVSVTKSLFFLVGNFLKFYIGNTFRFEFYMQNCVIVVKKWSNLH